mgnify:CR=1 FL=1
MSDRLKNLKKSFKIYSFVKKFCFHFFHKDFFKFKDTPHLSHKKWLPNGSNLLLSMVSYSYSYTL